MNGLKPRGATNRASRPGVILGPDCLEVFSNRLRADETWVQTLAVAGYPREVGPGWLSPLLAYLGPIDVALHVEPLRNDVAVGGLRRQLARHESTRRIHAARNRLADPELDAAVEDAGALVAAVARGEERLFRVGLYITVRGESEDALKREVERVRSLCASLLLDARPLPYRAVEAWYSTLPLGLDLIRLRRTFDTKALATCFPFASAELESNGGVLVGRNTLTGSLVFVDRFSLENHNQVVLAHSGKGKSYLAKLQILRSLCMGIEALVIDPENEYEAIARAAGGSVIRLGPDGDRLNPFDLCDAGRPDAVTRQVLFAHQLIEILVGAVPQHQKAALDRAAVGAYQAAGITSDPRTHGRPAPLLDAVVEALSREGAPDLAQRLEPYVSGSYRGLFDQPTTVRPEGQLVVFSTRDVPSALKAPSVMIALDRIWATVSRGERRRRLLVVDEAWLLLQSEVGAQFLERLARSARKYLCGLTTITQDVRDALSTELGHAVVTNASSQVILGQHPQALEALAEAFRLSQGERSYLMTCPRGHGLLCLGTERAPIEIIASDVERELMESHHGDPTREEAP